MQTDNAIKSRKLIDSRDYPVRAWTGGKSPTIQDWRTNSKLRAITRFMFEKQHIESGVPLDFWACAGTTPLERARILWNRAKLDAFATLGLN